MYSVMVKFFTFLLIQFACALVSADILPEISIRKMTAADILLIAPEQCSTENAEKMSTELNATHDCDIYGAYLICLAESKIGLFMLSDGSESTVLAGAHIDGFKTGKYVNCSIVLDVGHQLQGHFKNIHDKIKELVTPHIGQKHKFPGQVESAQNFEGILGVIDLHNIPGVFACLKVGATFVHVENARCWVLQFPGKANQDLNEQERVLGQMAEQIIAESLESFKSNSYLLNDRIPEEASAAVTKYYQPASL
jgi:hypothetical protein